MLSRNNSKNSVVYFFCLILILFPVLTSARTEAEDRELFCWDKHPQLRSADGKFKLSLRGLGQFRYEFLDAENSNDKSSFLFRRLDLDLRGHLHNPRLTFRINPELADEDLHLNVGWFNYKFSPGLQIRGGQFSVPFSLERDRPSSCHNFLELSAANNHFQWPGGGDKDIGITIHGKTAWHGTLNYAFGVFGGQGRLEKQAETSGNLYALRTVYTPLGRYKRASALAKPTAGINFSFGLGGYLAHDNTVRDWNVYSNNSFDTGGRVSSLTADLQFQTGRFSLLAEGFYHRIEPEQPGKDYNGRGFNGELGYLFLPEKFYSVCRISHSKPNQAEKKRRKKEIALAGQYYFRGHQNKLVTELTRIEKFTDGSWQEDKKLRLQYQFNF